MSWGEHLLIGLISLIAVLLILVFAYGYIQLRRFTRHRGWPK